MQQIFELFEKPCHKLSCVKVKCIHWVGMHTCILDSSYLNVQYPCTKSILQSNKVKVVNQNSNMACCNYTAFTSVMKYVAWSVR